MYYVSKRMEIAACHKLNLSYESKCANLHGHNWIITVYCKAEKLNKDGMVMDYSKLIALIKNGNTDFVIFSTYTAMMNLRHLLIENFGGDEFWQ